MDLVTMKIFKDINKVSYFDVIKVNASVNTDV